MGMRMASVVMIDRHPIERAAEIFLNPLHQSARKRLQVFIFDAVFGADDDTKLVAVALCLFEPFGAVNLIAIRTIELAATALARRTVALDIAQMRLGPHEPLARQTHGAEFSDDAALPKHCISIARREHAPDARAAPDPAAGEIAATLAGLGAAAREVRGGKYAVQEFARLLGLTTR